MPEAPVEDPQIHEKEESAEDDEENSGTRVAKIAADEDGESDDEEDPEPIFADKIPEIDPAYLVEQKGDSEGNQEESPENAALCFSRV